MGNRYFRAAIISGIGIIVYGSAVLIKGDTHNKEALVVGIIVFSILSSFAIWGIVNLIKGRSDNG